jgi:phenylalanyl-tRNA synthetase beta chain
VLRVPLSWLREFVPYDGSVTELAHRLAISTCEVVRIDHLGVPDEDGNLGLYRVGRVLEAGKHPNADRLQLCSVDVGEGEPRQIVCGAWNFGTGATVAVALPGAVLPGGQKLEEATLRGERSRGMILSERELELGTDHSGILVFAEAHEPGTPLTDVLPLRETVLEVETTGNRPDLLSIYGIAREVAALFRLELAPPPGEDPPMDGDEPVDVRIEDLAGCPRYIGRLFRDVRIGPSPPFLRARLHAAGMRAISNVVDATNYVMLELGNPLHAFDRTRLAEGRIVVRRARPGEEIRTLDGIVRKLDERDLMIADAEHSVAIAGIMGGEETEVTESTIEVLLEAANFEPTGLNATSERLKLRTEGLNRWEKGVDPYLAEQAAKRATGLIVTLAGARWVGHKDVQGELPKPPVVSFRTERASALIGIEVPEAEQAEILGRLGFLLGSDWSVQVPTWRARDVAREIDVVEEIARAVLDDVPFTLPLRRLMVGRLTPEQRLRRLVEDVLVGCGFSEAYTWSLVPAETAGDAVPLQEPLSAEQAVLRPALLPSLVDAVDANLNSGNEDVSLFEIARVYLPSGEQLPEERWHVAAVAQRDDSQAAFFRAKGALETLCSALKVDPRQWRDAVRILREGVAGFELDLAELQMKLPGVTRYEDVITYPAVKQDLAFVVPDDVPAGELVDAARQAAGPELRHIRIFDVYPGEKLGLPGKKSIALAVAFQSSERTLSDEDAAALRERIVKALADRYGAELRTG